MSNKSKLLIAVFIVAGIAGLIIFDLALSSSSGSSPPPAMAPQGSSNPRASDIPAARNLEEVVVRGMDTPATDSMAALLRAAQAQPPVTAAAPPAIPAPSAEPKAVKNPPAPAAAAGFPKTHKIASGDSWWTIAKQYYGEAQAHLYKRIQEANPELKDKLLPVGREIVIPPPPDTVRKGIADPERARDADVYTVQPGDTLEAISKKYYQSTRYAMEIFKFNQELIREPSLLRAGQQILIPKTPLLPAEIPNAPDVAVAPAANGERLHEVKPGDTLWDIAHKYAPDQAYAMMDRIVKANPEKLQSKSTPLRIGWKLRIPHY